MVTHSMQQSVDMPDRIIMMHKGKIVEDYSDEKKHRVRIPDLMSAFDRVRKRELFDETVAEMVIISLPYLAFNSRIINSKRRIQRREILD